MSNILTIGYTTEGSTDNRFLSGIIKRTFEEAAFECEGMIEVYDPICFESPKKDTFVENVLTISEKAFHSGINVLCIHVDADSDSDAHVMNYKITPSFNAAFESKK